MIDHHPVLYQARRYSAWCECQCGWRSPDYATMSGANLAFDDHLLEVERWVSNGYSSTTEST